MTFQTWLNAAIVALSIAVTQVAFWIKRRRGGCHGGSVVESDRLAHGTMRATSNLPARTHGEGPVIVYCAGSDGLRRLAKDLGLGPWYKIGVTSNHIRRFEDLASTRYASMKLSEVGFTHEPGFDRWQAQKLVDPEISHSRAIKRVPCGIEVHLPNRMTLRQFEARLRGALEGVSLYAYLRAIPSAARASFAVRFTPNGRTKMPSLATEIVTFRPRNRDDVGRLIRAIETIIDEKTAF